MSILDCIYLRMWGFGSFTSGPGGGGKEDWLTKMHGLRVISPGGWMYIGTQAPNPKPRIPKPKALNSKPQALNPI